jgi:D-alanyl-D-alanine dipeptidase
LSTGIGIEAVPGHPDFRALRDIPGILFQLRYATADNFVGRDLYSPFDCAWLHRDGAEALEHAVAQLRLRDASLRLLVLDALRPQRVQERMWAALQGTGLQIYLANPQRGSIHSFGMAVDVTLCDAQGRELDMGTPFDDLSERSHPVLEERFLAEGSLARDAVERRCLLRDVMAEAGWQGITREWWHFDAGDRENVRSTYERVL